MSSKYNNKNSAHGLRGITKVRVDSCSTCGALKTARSGPATSKQRASEDLVASICTKYLKVFSFECGVGFGIGSGYLV